MESHVITTLASVLVTQALESLRDWDFWARMALGNERIGTAVSAHAAECDRRCSGMAKGKAYGLLQGATATQYTMADLETQGRLARLVDGVYSALDTLGEHEVGATVRMRIRVRVTAPKGLDYRPLTATERSQVRAFRVQAKVQADHCGPHEAAVFLYAMARLAGQDGHRHLQCALETHAERWEELAEAHGPT